MVRTFKERFLRFRLSFLDFYHFHHVIWEMKWAKKPKTKNGLLLYLILDITAVNSASGLQFSTI